MSRIDELIEQGEILSKDISVDKYNDISEWFTEVQYYAEENHKNLKLTSTLISNIQDYKNLVRSERMADEFLFNDVLSAIKGMKKSEEASKKKNSAGIGRMI